MSYYDEPPMEKMYRQQQTGFYVSEEQRKEWERQDATEGRLKPQGYQPEHPRDGQGGAPAEAGRGSRAEQR